MSTVNLLSSGLLNRPVLFDVANILRCGNILEVDPNLRVCFISAAPKLGFGCFIKKPVEMGYLVERLCAELD